MGYIKEPEGIDLIINSDSLTEADSKAISEFIKKDKAKHATRLSPKKQLRSAKNKQLV